ncbi:MAG: hypothetical protein R3B90_12055 [Planctomycetaceae bacterium]
MTGLSLIGLLYLALAIWCATLPQSTSATVGLQRSVGQGESEYLAVYGGLQLALGLLFLLPLANPKLLAPMLLACVVVHASLVTMRLASFAIYSGFSRTTYLLAGCEVALLLLASGMLWCHGLADVRPEA